MDELTPAEEKYFETKGTVAPESPAAGSAAPVFGDAPSEPDQSAPPADGAATNDGTGEPSAEEQRSARRVPLAELLSERERRRNAEGELARNRVRLSAIEGQLASIATDDAALPDASKDPEGYAKALAARAERTKSALQNMRVAAETQVRQAEVADRFLGLYRAQIEEFAKRQPDYQQAYSHLAADRDAELTALGYADPAARLAIMQQEEATIVARALWDGANAAERLYSAARRRGYKPGSGAQEKLRLVERGQAAGRSLGAAPGGATRAVSPEALANLGDAEFAEATKGEKWRRLFTA